MGYIYISPTYAELNQFPPVYINPHFLISCCWDLAIMPHLTSKDLQRIFHKLDKNGDKVVSLEELNLLLERIGVKSSLDELAWIVSKPRLDFDEFAVFYESISNSEYGPAEEDAADMEMGDLVKAFQVFDVNGDGVISCEELQIVLSRLGLWDENSGKDCGNIIRVFDTNLDGVLDFEEFKNMMLQP